MKYCFEFEQAKEVISHELTKIIETKAIRNEELSNVDANDQFEIFLLAVKHNVCLKFVEK